MASWIALETPLIVLLFFAIWGTLKSNLLFNSMLVPCSFCGLKLNCLENSFVI